MKFLGALSYFAAILMVPVAISSIVIGTAMRDAPSWFATVGLIGAGMALASGAGFVLTGKVLRREGSAVADGTDNGRSTGERIYLIGIGISVCLFGFWVWQLLEVGRASLLLSSAALMKLGLMLVPGMAIAKFGQALSASKAKAPDSR